MPSKLGPQASEDLASMTCWHADSCKVLGRARVIISIGPISYLGSCNFGKQCIVLETLPIDLQLALPHHQLENYSWHDLNFKGAFCIICAMSMNRFPNVYTCLLFQSSARMPRNFYWLPTRRERSKITGFTSFAQHSFWVNIFGEKMKMYVDQMYKLTC